MYRVRSSVGVALFELQILVVNLRARLLVEEAHANPLSHAGDGAANPMLAVALLRRCWSWRDVTVESCW
jgi:hypothetical protein